MRCSLAIGLIALPLAATLSSLRAQSDLRSKVNHALDSARPALVAHLRHAATQRARPGELALVMLAAIHDGIAPSDPDLAKAIEKLGKASPDQTYDLALRLLVMELLPAFPDRDETARDDVKKLLKHRDEGAFGYMAKGAHWDLSNTQYAALGLRAAAAMGVPIERGVWSKLGKTIGEQQDSYGGFGYTGANSGFEAYASMTAAGIAVLAICRQELGEENNKQSSLTKQIGRGWQWFDRNLATIGSVTERWSFYFHYGLERAAILCDVEEISGQSWYDLGAQMLVDQQLPGGGWRSDVDAYQGDNQPRGRGTSVATSFAVLFLRRKFQKVAGPITPRVVTLPTIGPNSKDADVEACADELKRRGKEAMADVLRALRSEIPQQRRAAAAALTVIAGQDFGFDPAVEGDANREAVKNAELWFLRNR